MAWENRKLPDFNQKPLFFNAKTGVFTMFLAFFAGCVLVKLSITFALKSVNSGNK